MPQRKDSNGAGKVARKSTTTKVAESKTVDADGKSLPAAIKIYEAIRSDIITLVLKPGQKVSEQALVDRYKIGKAPVRTAVARLVQEGLIENEPRGGRYVSAVTLKDMRNLYGIRRLLLPEAAAQVAAAAVPPPALEAATQRVLSVEYSPGNPDSILEFCFANRDFIVEMGRCSSNELLAELITSLEDRALRVIFFNSLALPRVDVMREQYHAIWKAIASGDSNAARLAVQHALAESESAAIDAVLRLPQLQSVNLAI